MGRKKKRKSVQIKPFCYYCDRKFESESVLIQHQKAKHFKCEHCNKKLGAAPALMLHVVNVHKMPIDRYVILLAERRNRSHDVVRMRPGYPMQRRGATRWRWMYMAWWGCHLSCCSPRTSRPRNSRWGSQGLCQGTDSSPRTGPTAHHIPLTPLSAPWPRTAHLLPAGMECPCLWDATRLNLRMERLLEGDFQCSQGNMCGPRLAVAWCSLLSLACVALQDAHEGPSSTANVGARASPTPHTLWTRNTATCARFPTTTTATVSSQWRDSPGTACGYQLPARERAQLGLQIG